MLSSDCQTPHSLPHEPQGLSLESTSPHFQLYWYPIPFTSDPRKRFGARSQRRHNRQPDACAVGPRLKPRLWRQRQRPAPSALATVLTGTRSGYFFRIFSPSERRFSNGCSSLYTNFILPGTGLDRAGLREPGGGRDGGRRRRQRRAGGFSGAIPGLAPLPYSPTPPPANRGLPGCYDTPLA